MTTDSERAAEPPVETMVFRVERTEWCEIEVNLPGLIAEWCDGEEAELDRDDVREVLHQIGVQDLMYSGDFIAVLDRDTEESIQ